MVIFQKIETDPILKFELLCQLILVNLLSPTKYCWKKNKKTSLANIEHFFSFLAKYQPYLISTLLNFTPI